MNSTKPLTALASWSLAFLVAALLFPLLSLPTLAAIDLVSPADNQVSNVENMTFEYYPSLANVTECTLSIDETTFTDTTITNNAFNTFTVIGIDPGTHTWRITCQNSATTDLSVIRHVRIDRTPPTLSILSPTEGSISSNDLLAVLAADDGDQAINCTAEVGLDTIGFTAQSNVSASNSLGLVVAGPYTVFVNCIDVAGNSVSRNRSFLYAPPLTVTLSTDKQVYGLGEQVLLTVNATAGADVDLEICPDAQGFVQCFTPLIGTTFPQLLILPYTNKTGRYIVEATGSRYNQTAYMNLSYQVNNTMSVRISATGSPAVNQETILTAVAAGAAGAVNYTWQLSNGSTVRGSTVTRRYTTVGTFTERVVAIDANGNNASANYVATVLPDYTVTILVVDSISGTAIQNATVQLVLFDSGTTGTSETKFTGTDGKIIFLKRLGDYKLFVSKDGYSYALNETSIDKDVTITVRLTPFDNKKPVVTITRPANGATVSLPVEIGYTVSDQGPVSCAISYGKAGDQWLQQGVSQNVNDAAEHLFSLPSMEEAAYTFLIECTDESDNLGKSETRGFIVTQNAQAAAEDGAAEEIITSETNPDATFSADSLDVIDRAYGAFDSFTPEQKSLAEQLGWETMVKEKKRVIERATRDIQALEFRRDLTEQEKIAKRNAFEAEIAEAVRTTPLDLAILEKRAIVQYLSDEDLLVLAEAIAQQKKYPGTPEQLVAYLKTVQQDFTQERTVIRAKILFGSGEQPLSIVSSSFKYRASQSNGATSAAVGSPDPVIVATTAGGLSGSYTLYESLPASLASRATEILTKNEMQPLGTDPLAIEFAPDSTVVYYVKKDISLDTLAQAKTVLLKKPSESDLRSMTGAVFGFGSVTYGFDWKLSLILTVALALLIFLIRWIDLGRHLRFFFYQESRKRPMHEVKTLIDDGLAQLEASNFEQAVLRYKEAKLSYERLDKFAQNETYDDLISFKDALDKGYFTLLEERIKAAIDQGRLEDAVDDFSRLEGTYGMLGPQEQERLYEIVLLLGKRLGLEESPERSGGAA